MSLRNSFLSFRPGRPEEAGASRAGFQPASASVQAGCLRYAEATLFAGRWKASLLPASAAVVLLGLLLATGARAELRPGDAFPALASAGLVGTVPSLAGQVAVVDFWASWCAPCKASFPVYARLQADYAARGLVVLAVSVDQRAADYAGFLRRFNPPFATVHDAQQRLVSLVKVPTMPTSYVLGRDGRVRFVHVGFHGASTEKELRAQIETLLAEKP